MRSKSWKSIIIRSITPIALTIFVIVAIFYKIFIPYFMDNLLECKKSMLNELVNLNWNLLKNYDDRVKSGELTLQEAQKRALKRINSLRYGENQKDYFWINDYKGNLLMHPFKSNLEGNSLYDMKDKTGKYFMREFIKKGKTGGGFIYYYWGWKYNQEVISKKLAYVKSFKPWGWIVGTGLYLTDLDQKILNITKRINLVFLIFMSVVLLLLGIIIYRNIENEKKRINSDTKFRNIINSATDVLIIATDMDGIIKTFNKGAEKILGYKADELIDKKTPLIFHDSDQIDKIERELSKKFGKNITGFEIFHQLAKNFDFKYRDWLYVTKNKKIMNVDLVITETFDHFGKKTGLLGVATDITERKNIENKLKKNRDKLSAIFNATTESIFIHDAYSGDIIDVNEAATKMYGYNKEEFVTKLSLSIISSNEPNYTKLEAFNLIKKAREKGPQLFEWRGKHKNGKIFWCEVALKYSKIDQKEVIIAVVRDIDKRKKTEEELKTKDELLHQTQKMESIGQLAGGIAHDFNNMLAGIIGATEVIELDEDDENRDYVNMIKKTSQRAADLTNKLLAFSRKGKILSTSIDLHTTIKDAISILERSIDKKVKVVSNFDAKRSKIVGDPSQLQNAILNIAINGRDAMPNGGTLNFSTKNIYLDDEKLQLSPFDISEGDYIELLISDSGVGIMEQNRKKIFEPFFTTKPKGKGTGLGLAAVYGTVKNHKGFIDLETELNKGTTFKIYFPLDKEISIENREVFIDLKYGDSGILVIDDEDIIRTTAKHMLKKLGYTPFLAKNGFEGIEKYKKHRDKIDIVILDMVMPEMGGEECFYKLKEIDSDIKIIVSSGFTNNDSIKKMRKDGLSGFIGKPYRMLEISNLINTILKK